MRKRTKRLHLRVETIRNLDLYAASGGARGCIQGDDTYSSNSDGGQCPKTDLCDTAAQCPSQPTSGTVTLSGFNCSNGPFNCNPTAG